MLTGLFGWCNFPTKTYNSRNILYSYPGCFIQKQSNYELKHTYQLLGMAGTLRMLTSNPSIKDPLLPRRVQSTPLSELQCIIWLFHSDIEGQSVREKIWERGCAGNQEKHFYKKNQNVYSAFQSPLCEVCLTDKLLSKTTSNKKSISAHRLEKRFCYFAKLCLIRMVIKLKWKTIVTLLQVKFETYSEENAKPGEVICKLAKDVNANLIVMGSRGMGTLRRTLLGSVSDYCVHHAHIPVAIVPPPNRHGGHARSS